MEILFATSNEAKLEQLRFVARARGFDVAVVAAKERFGEAAVYGEAGETPREIALRGALEVAGRLGVPVFTEDTAFYVDALGGEPGVKAGAFLKRHGRNGLLRLLEHESERYAAVVSGACYATPDGRGLLLEHAVHGRVAEEERWGDHPSWVAPRGPGDLGGGYNAIFVPDGHERTLAEIAPKEALGWSYREHNFEHALAALARGVELPPLPAS